MNRVMTLGRILLASTVATTLLFAAACGSTPDMNYGGANTAATGRRRCRLSSTGPDPTGRSTARRAGPVKAGEMLGPTVHNGLLTT
jgi:hypothetical protein